MSRRSFLVAIGILVFVGGTISGALFVLLRYEPGHYRRAATTPGEQRTKLSEDFLREFCDFRDSVTKDKDWYGSFSDEQINSYLDEGFMRSGLGEQLLPDGISEPRIIFQPERIHLAFRYRSQLINTVVSITLRVWLSSSEGNVMAVALEGFRAGALPFSAQWLLERISEIARQNSIEVTWYRHEGHPVALLRFQADQARPTLQFKAIKLEEGKLTIHGRTDDGQPASSSPASASTERSK
jgi:hypothetical protein